MEKKKIPLESQTEREEKQLEHSKYVYEQVNGWIENADNKVSVSCGVFTGVFGVISFLSQKTATAATVNECLRSIYKVSFALGLVVMGFSILFYVLAINPNIGSSGMSNKKQKLKKKYPIFYGDIADETLEQYKAAMRDGSVKDFIDELQTEIHYNSPICNKKMLNYKWGMWMSFVAVVLAGISWGARFLMYR